MVSSHDWVQSCTALSTTGSSIILEDTVGKHTLWKQPNKDSTSSALCISELSDLYRRISVVFTWLLLHCIQDPFNNIIQFRGTDGLQHLHKVPAGFTGAQNNKKNINVLSFLPFVCWHKMKLNGVKHGISSIKLTACVLMSVEKNISLKQLKCQMLYNQ